jgi:hypothetical protein
MYTVWFNKSAIEKSETAATRDQRIAALDNIINTLIGAAANAALNGDKKEYRLDDGQTKISVVYQDLNAISAAITSLERVKQMYLNRNVGRQSKNMDYKNFVGGNWWGNLNC